MKKILFSFLFLCGCIATPEGQKTFYWERPNTGVAWFAKDHQDCMISADQFPFEWPGMPWDWGNSKRLNLRFDNDSDHGVWAQFIPYPGAKPVFVNYAHGDWSVDYDDYQKCMEERHYSQRRAPRIHYQVFPQ